MRRFFLFGRSENHFGRSSWAAFLNSQNFANHSKPNLRRRHLNEGQRAMVAAKLANMPPHRPVNKSANLQTLAVSQSDAAAMLNVSERSVASADSGEP